MIAFRCALLVLAEKTDSQAKFSGVSTLHSPESAAKLPPYHPVKMINNISKKCITNDNN